MALVLGPTPQVNIFVTNVPKDKGPELNCSCSRCLPRTSSLFFVLGIFVLIPTYRCWPCCGSDHPEVRGASVLHCRVEIQGSDSVYGVRQVDVKLIAVNTSASTALAAAKKWIVCSTNVEELGFKPLSLEYS